MKRFVRVRKHPGGKEVEEEYSKGFRVVQKSFSWDDVDTRDPAVGVLLATVGPREQIAFIVMDTISPLVGPDADSAYGYLGSPGVSVADAYIAYAGNSDSPTIYTSPTNNVGAVYAAFASYEDNAVAVDLTGGEISVTLLILGYQ